MSRRTLISPSGQRGSVEEADFPSAIAAGYRAATPEELARAEAAQHPVQAAIEGAADSATFGASKRAEKAFLQARQMDPSQVDLRAEENPLAHGAGEVAGLFTPGPGWVSAGVKGVVKGIGSKTVQRLAGGGLEGGLYGLSAAINEDHMGDPKLAAENVAAGTIASSLVGAGLTAGFGKVGDLGRSALVKAFGGKGVSETLSSMAEKSLMGHLGADLTKEAPGVARYALDNGIAKGVPSFKTVAERAAERAQGHMSQIESALDAADAAAKFDPTKVADRLQPIVDGMDKNPALKGDKKRLQSFVDEFRDVGTPAGPGQIPPEWREVRPGVFHNQQANTFHSPPPPTAAVEGTAPNTFRKAWETVNAMGEQGPQMLKLRKQLQEEMAAQMPAEIGEAWKKANAEYAHAATLHSLSGAKADAAKSLTAGDLALGAAGFMQAGPVGMLAPYLKRAGMERGGFVAASAMDALAQSGAMPKLAKGFQLLIRKGLESGDAFGGVFRATLETAAAKSAMDLLQTHLSLAQTQPDYMASIGLEHEDPSTVAEHTDRAHRFGQLSNALDESSAATDKHIDRILGTQSGRPPSRSRREPTRAEFDDVKAKLTALTGYDGADKRQLSELAPTTAALAQMGTVSAAQYLLDTAPKNPTEGLPPALQRPWNPAQATLRDWFRRVETVEDPRSVLDSIRRGDARKEQIETLEQVYPRMYRDFQEKMQERLSTWTEPLDRKRRGQISKLIGDLNDPRVTQLIQAAHLRANPPPTGAKPDGREKIDVDKNMQTQAQRLEGK